MRIAYLSNSTIPSSTANSVHVMKMCQGLADNGHGVILVARVGSDRRDANDFQTYGVAPSFQLHKHNLKLWGQAGRALYPFCAAASVRNSPAVDLIYSRHRLGAACAVALGLPLILESHCAPCSWEWQLEARLFRRPNFVRLVVISEALRREYQRLHPELSPDRIVVAHDAADSPWRGPQDLAVQGLPGRPDVLRVGYVGHLYRGKGMEMIAALADKIPDVDFHVIGGNGKDVERWKAISGSPANLIFHGHVSPCDTDRYRLAMDVLVAPYQQEVHNAGGSQDIARWMSPLKIFEYMAAGKPIIASDLPVLREVLEHDRQALLVAPTDITAWSEAIRRLAEPGLRKRLGDEALRTFQASHTWQHRAQLVLNGLGNFRREAS